jgi:hypothetical protein
MPALKTDTYIAAGDGWSPVCALDGGFGRDFAFKIYRRTWFDTGAQRLSCAALNPTGEPTNLFFHLDIPMFAEVDAAGNRIREWLADTINIVVWDNGEWRNKRSLMAFLHKHYTVDDAGREFAGAKPVDLVMEAQSIPLAMWENQRCVTKATWNDFELLIVFDLPQKLIEIREIDPANRAPLLAYLSDPSKDVPREIDGAKKTPKAVIDEMLSVLTARLDDYAPRLSLSARTIRLTVGLRSCTLRFPADRNNRAGRYVGVGLEVEFTGAAPPEENADLMWRTRNLNGGFGYELSRHGQRALIVKNLGALVDAWIAPWLRADAR